MARGEMSPEHKEALARGRQQARVVRDYLQALHTDGQRGRPISRQSLEAKIERLQAQIDEEPNAVRRVELIQQRLDAERRLARHEESVDRQALERDFITVAKEYSQRRGITYAAWREAGGRPRCCAKPGSRAADATPATKVSLCSGVLYLASFYQPPSTSSEGFEQPPNGQAIHPDVPNPQFLDHHIL